MLAETQKHAESARKQLQFASFDLKTLTPHMGAEIHGLDLSKPLDEHQSRDLDAAFRDWMVLVFRDQELNREQHKAFGRRFGKLHSHPMHKVGLRGDDPEILPVVTTADSPYTAGDGWHTDVTCDAIPPLGSILYLSEMPESGGGDTLFANMALAYELLSPPIQQFLGGLNAVHDGAKPYIGAYKSEPPEGGYPTSEHPVITRHPESGARVLYVNSGFTTHLCGLASHESSSLLSMLFDHIANTPRIHCRVRWEPKTVTLWDNRCTQHHAIWDYYPHSRRGERVSVCGEEPPRI
ncbi:TauD/TfdA family dioxygenase [Myxococcota bacterium]|nr:TauD/TfdA family dioxygenase [Myxococcota bacterium]